MGCEVCKQSDKTDSTTISAAGSDHKGVLLLIQKVKLFQRLPPEDHSILAAACAQQEYSEGQVLITEGETGNELFVLIAGQVSVSKGGKEIATLCVGDYFGENALLRNEPRSATITATTNVKALTLRRDKFRELGLNEKLEFKKRQAVGGGGDKTIATRPPSAKSPVERQQIINALKNNKNLSEICELDDTKCNELVDIAWTENVPAGKEIIQEGDLDADYFYIVKEGSFEVLKVQHEGGKSADEAVAAAHVGDISKGGSFGELALLYFAPRAATVKADVDAVVYVIDRYNFKNIISKTAIGAAEEDRVRLLEKVEILSSLLPDEKLEIGKALVEMSFTQGERIFEQGEKGESFYILYDGQVSVSKSGKEVATLRGTPTKAEIFGELALLNDNARTATIMVVSPTAKTLSLDKESFDMLLGPLEDIKKRGKSGQSKVGKGKKKEAAKKTSDHILRKDLERVGLLGCGGFGAVELVSHVKTHETYALKALSKGYIVKCGMKKGVMSEKNIQLMCDSPFIVKLYETYNGDQSLYFLLELALGGEIYATYSKKGFHGSEKHAKFYVAGTVFAFEHLHERKIIFRDLKSENLLLTEEGRVKLTDMGLAKVCVGKTFTTCGTPDYFAPELIASQGHTNAVDWWTLGILLFELMAGHPPFEAPNPMQIYSKVAKGINKVAFPPELQGSGEDIVKKLLVKEPTDRLPMKKGGTSRIKQHAWFKEFDWDAMKNLTLTPPYIPKVKSKKDIGNFSARKEDMPPQVKYKDDGTGWDKDFATSQ